MRISKLVEVGSDLWVDPNRVLAVQRRGKTTYVVSDRHEWVTDWSAESVITAVRRAVS